AGTTTLASVGSSQTGTITDLPEITPDGRYVAFYSTATNLVSGVQSTSDIYVRDLLNNVTSQASANARTIAQSVFGANNIICCNHTISDDGQFVAFEAAFLPSLNGSKGVILRYNTQTTATDIV